jgi:LexA-binding, inner membrane-associated putative hydrolase
MVLDIAIGIIGAIIASKFLAMPLTAFLVVASIFFSLSPDADFLIHLFLIRKTDKFSHEHRDILHNPLVFIPAGFLIIAPISVLFAVLFAVMSLAHFIHDSLGIGWGVRWFYPFSKKYYKYSHGFVGWTPEEQHALAEEHGDPDWLKHHLSSREFIAECVSLVLALVLLYVLF